VLEEKAGQEAGLVPAGHRIVNTWLSAHFDEAAWAAGQMTGIAQLFFLRRLAQQIDQNWSAVQEHLELLRATLLNANSMLCNVTVDAANLAMIQPRLRDFLGDLPTAPMTPTEWHPDYAARNEALTIPAQVNYVGKAANLFEHGFERHGSAQVINKYLGTTWLWEQIRVKGGAYGGFSRFDPRSGIFNFTSYRDPNLLATIETYDRTSTFLREVQLDQAELERAIVGTIGDVDTYQLPDAKGFTSLSRYLAGETDELRQEIREEILGTSVGDFRRFADAVDLVKEHGVVAVLGSDTAVAAANEQRPGLFTEVTRVLPE
jgi:hypothetical protein